MDSWQHSPSATTVAHFVVDPYRFPGAGAFDAAGSCSTACGGLGGGDWPAPWPASDAGPAGLSAPDPRERLETLLPPVDRRRLDLNVALTAAGIAPAPGDRQAIEALSLLDDATHVALRRWLTATH
ncbi:hypothetical protein ABCR94_29365 [Streptomyces sp. 21So2-11]|uniref:hypothetical protein n=1 Tax=Streptomyces sp. 21So2-11 TaxID=3144408 RepID=UPI00321A907E